MLIHKLFDVCVNESALVMAFTDEIGCSSSPFQPFRRCLITAHTIRLPIGLSRDFGNTSRFIACLHQGSRVFNGKMSGPEQRWSSGDDETQKRQDVE
jgi:hypothetical protein